jgi:hypothetical protein
MKTSPKAGGTIMAKKQPKAKITNETVWEYEYNLILPNEAPEVIWIPEDDERSASYKAVKPSATGRIRSREETIRTIKGDREIIEASEWAVKVQTLV